VIASLLLLCVAVPQTDATATLTVEAGLETELGRHLCAVSGDDRVHLVDGQLVVPPGLSTHVSVAAGDCGAPAELEVRIVPVVNHAPSSARLFVDEGRLELRGVGAGASVWWRFEPGRWRSDACVAPAGAEAAAACSVAVGIEDARAGLAHGPPEVLRLPPGTPAPAGEGLPELWAHLGRRVGTLGLDELKVPIEKTVFDAPLVRASSVEAWREQNVLPLALTGAVASVNCRPGSCWVADDGAAILAVPPAASDVVTFSARLRAGYALQTADGLVTSVTFNLPVARCQLRPLAPAVLAGTEDHLLPVILGERCPGDMNDLAAETTPPSAAFIERFAADSRRADVRLGHVPKGIDSLELRLVRASTRVIVGSTRLDVRTRYAPVQVHLLDAKVGELSVIPTNRDVRLEWASNDRKIGPDIVPVSLPGYYGIRRVDGVTYIRGENRTVGEIPLVFAYQPAGLAGGAPLVTFESDEHFPVRAVNVPVSLAADDPRTGKMISLICRDSSGAEREIAPGDFVSLPWSSRGSCHLRVDRSVLTAEDGTQHIRVTLAITSPSGVVRDGGFSRVMALSAAADTDALWFGPGNPMLPFDHISVHLSHDDEPGYYVVSGGPSGIPSRRYQLVFGDARLRVYGSATVPTGLYRVTRGVDSGVLQFNAGIIARLAFLDREGKEYPLDLELGLLGTDLSGHAALSVVAGPGITVPLLNPQQAAQAAIGIHAWVEWAPGRTGDGRRPFAFIFGPSISLGDFGANL
jgi:hypothetical protein